MFFSRWISLHYSRTLLTLVLSLLCAGANNATAQSLISITPSVELRSGSVPPQQGVELFVFAGGSFGTEYTAVFSVTEQPAAVVVIPAFMSSYTYDSNAGTVTVIFEHASYLEGVELFGPETDFSIAFISAVGAGESGPPQSLKGSWMSTNVSPNGWEIISPTPSNPTFGYTLSGPTGGTAYFTLFIPKTMIDAIALVAGENVTAEDLAVFNGSAQSSLSVTPQDGGAALFNLQVDFSSTDTEFDEFAGQTALACTAAQAISPKATVDKSITVNRQANLSIAANPSGKIKSGKRAKLFGCLAARYDFSAGEKITLAGQDKPIKAALDSNGCYSKSLKFKKTSKMQAQLKKNVAAGRTMAIRSKTLKVSVK